MANDASNYYASIGKSIVQNDGSNELTSAINASAQTYAMNMVNQQELFKAIDSSVDNLSLTTKDANGNYTGFGKMFHDAVASDKADQIDKSADMIKQQKMDELDKMQNDLLATQNNIQVDGLAQSITGQNYSDFKGRLQEAVEQKYLSGGGRPVSYDTLQYYIQNPSLVVDAAKAHEVAAQNGTVADTTLAPQDIAGLRAVLQDKNLITLFEKDRYIDLEKKRLESGYFTPAENLDRARMLKQANSWGYNTSTTQQVADLLNNQTAGIMGRKEGESYEENYDRIVNANNQVDLSASIDRFGFPISSAVNGSPATTQQANGNPITNSVNQATQQTDISSQEYTSEPSTINEKGEILTTFKFKDSKGKPAEIELAVNDDNYTPEGRREIEDATRSAAKLKEREEELDYNKNSYINDQQKEVVITKVAQMNELMKKGDMFKPSNWSLSNWEDSLYDQLGNWVGGMSEGKIADFFSDNADVLGIGAIGLGVAGGTGYGVYKYINPSTGETVEIPEKGSVPDKEFKQALDKAGITEEQYNTHKQKTLDRYREFSKQAVKDGKMTQADYDKLFDKDGNPTQFNEQRMKEEFKKKYGKSPTKQDIDKAKEAFGNERKGIINKLKNIAVDTLKGAKGIAKGASKTLAKIASKSVLGAAGLIYGIASAEAEVGDIVFANGYYRKDIQDVQGINDPDLELDNLRSILDRANNVKKLEIDFNNPNMPEPYANISINELERQISNINYIVRNIKNPRKFDIIKDTLSPVQSLGKDINSDRRLSQYEDLLKYLNNIKDIKTLYTESYAGQKADINKRYEANRTRFNYWSQKGIKPELWQGQAEHYQQLADNAKTQEEKVKYQELAFNYQKMQAEHANNLIYQEQANRATAMGYNLTTPAGQEAYNKFLSIMSPLNDATANSAKQFMTKDTKSPDKFENKIATYGREAPLIAAPLMIGNGFALGNIDAINSENFGEIAKGFQKLYNVISSGDIQGLASGDGNLYSAYKDLKDAFSDSKEFRDNFRGFQHIEVLDREVRELKNDSTIQRDAILSASLGNTIKNLDAIGLYALKAALFAYKNRNADFTDPETMKEILNVNIKQAIKERVQLAKQQKKNQH